MASVTSVPGGKGHILYTDNYYTSPALAEFLLLHKTGLCGTVKANRKRMAEFSKGAIGDVVLQASGKVLAISFTDKRQVLMLSTAHKGELIDTRKTDRRTGAVVKKPIVICDYNINMRLVDKADMMSSYTECLRKTRKWPTCVFQHLLRLCLLNAFILFKQVNQNYKKFFREFSSAAMAQILARNRTSVQHPCDAFQMISF